MGVVKVLKVGVILLLRTGIFVGIEAYKIMNNKK
jgi:hypothetical protein